MSKHGTDGPDARGRGILRGLMKLASTGKADAELSGVIGADSARQLEQLIRTERAANPPRIAVIGKAGVGKTTTINSVFSVRMHTSHALQGTSAAQLKRFELTGGGTLEVIDLPGLGESIEDDRVFAGIYREELPKADVVLYVLSAEERLLAEDQRIFDEVVLPAFRAGSATAGGRVRRLVIGLNKIDIIGPGKWDDEINYPDEQKEESIRRRAADIAAKLSDLVPDLVPENIVHYSAERRFRLHDLLLALVTAAGAAAWKLPLAPADPFELATSEEARQLAADWRRTHERY
ncbi:GTPase family protein [Kitasatospora sp. NPDC057015]|uniref:GTPase family protein n=1 Tax=Kitasatospora sp. NPDC057015 TaxID=3346001 RepID=UPI003644EB97